MGRDRQDRKFSGKEVLPEYLQEQDKPMALVATDVTNQLDVNKVVEEVRQAILDIQWREIDYLEAAWYIALNWTEEQCRSSCLWRFLLGQSEICTGVKFILPTCPRF